MAAVAVARVGVALLSKDVRRLLLAARAAFSGRWRSCSSSSRC